ncbi:hypothetical protein [Flavobacterium terrisoli]|uniref:hypothetical protein n=1 Tax=Flavobacterium terrisoli TaxID=3242195 RepID=UPI0025426F85|nr:hypothetical protein [Flavobacterium buctense]
MKAVFAVLFLLIFSLKGFSQFESPNKTLKMAPVPKKSGTIAPASTSTPKSITYPSIFDKKDKLLESVSLLNKKPEQEKSIMEKEQFENPSKMYTEKMNRKGSDGEILEKFRSDTFLGEFKIGTKTMRMACRDHEAPDGDVVRVWLNDKVVIDAILLDVAFREVFMELKEGINKIEIEAMNQGESGPNTAQFVIYDANGGMVTTNKWNLTTGVRAKLVILKQDGLIKKKE